MLAIAVLALFNVLLWQRVQRLESLPERLPAGWPPCAAPRRPPRPGAPSSTTRRAPGDLVVEGLLPSSPGRQYQLWLIRDGARASGGAFSVSPRGYGTLEVSAPLPVGSYQAFGVTVEPQGAARSHRPQSPGAERCGGREPRRVAKGEGLIPVPGGAAVRNRRRSTRSQTGSPRWRTSRPEKGTPAR